MNRKTIFRPSITLVAATVASLLAAPGLKAQDGDGANTVALQEIIVTARKREEALQDVPLTVTAVGAERIAELAIKDARDLALYVPGFSNVASFGRNSSERPTIRGQSNILGAPNASYFIDGVYISGSASNTETASLERIEVIKGPQSALFGRATFAGAINYVTRKPSEDTEGKVSVTFGEFNQRDLSAYVSGPIGEGSVRYFLSGTMTDLGGYYLNPLDRRDKLGAEKTDAVTGKLFWTPSDAIEVTALVTYLEDDDGPPAFGFQGRQFNNIKSGAATSGGPPRSPGYYQGTALTPDKLVIAQLTTLMPDPGIQRERTRAALTASVDFGGGYQLVSTSGYSTEDYSQSIDVTYAGYVWTLAPSATVPAASSALDAQWRASATAWSASSLGSFQRVVGEEREDFSSELRLSSPVDRSFRWSVGAYYFEGDDNDAQNDKVYPNGGAIVPNGNGTLTFRNVKNTAFFGGLEYDFNESLTVTAEVRRGEDEIINTSSAFTTPAPGQAPTAALNGVRVVSAPLSTSFEKTTPRFTIRYKLNPSLTVFANYAEGNKPGGFNSASVRSALLAAGRTFVDVLEETSENVELGVKFSIGQRVSGSITAYDIKLLNQQLTQNIVVNGIPTSFTENSGETSSRGAELELALRLGESFDVGIGASVNDATFVTYVNADQANLYSNLTAANLRPIAATNPTGCGTLGATTAAISAACTALIAQDLQRFGDVAGKRTPRAPEWNGYISARYTQPLSDNIRLVVGADMTAEGSKFAQVHNLIETGDRQYVNARFGIETDNWNVTLWGRNLNDDDTAIDILRYVDGIGGATFVTPNGQTFGNRGFGISLPKPRQFGLSASYKF